MTSRKETYTQQQQNQYQQTAYKQPWNIELVLWIARFRCKRFLFVCLGRAKKKRSKNSAWRAEVNWIAFTAQIINVKTGYSRPNEMERTILCTRYARRWRFIHNRDKSTSTYIYIVDGGTNFLWFFIGIYSKQYKNHYFSNNTSANTNKSNNKNIIIIKTIIITSTNMAFYAHRRKIDSENKSVKSLADKSRGKLFYAVLVIVASKWDMWTSVIRTKQHLHI